MCIRDSYDIYETVGDYYLDLKQYENAKKYIDLAMAGNSAWFRLLLARYYLETGFPEKARVIYSEIKNDPRNSSAHPLLASSLMGLCQVIQCAKTAFEIARTHN